MISEVRLCDKHQKRVSGVKEIQFVAGVNCIIGPNGSGKSTILGILGGVGGKCDCKMITDKPTNTMFFDSEKSNPRIKNNVTSGFDVVCLWKSHGQTLLAVYKGLERGNLEGADLVIVDEPESGLDFRGIQELGKVMGGLRDRKIQVVVASHNPIIWMYADSVISLDGTDYQDAVLNAYRGL